MIETYYDFIEEIWELTYGLMPIDLFCYQWVRLDEIKTNDNEGFTTFDLQKTAYRDDPFVLAKDVIRVFYARDNVNNARSVVFEGKRKIVGVDGVMDE